MMFENLFFIVVLVVATTFTGVSSAVAATPGVVTGANDDAEPIRLSPTPGVITGADDDAKPIHLPPTPGVITGADDDAKPIHLNDCKFRNRTLKDGETYTGKGKGPSDRDCLQFKCTKGIGIFTLCNFQTPSADYTKCHLEPQEGTYPACCDQKAVCDGTTPTGKV